MNTNEFGPVLVVDDQEDNRDILGRILVRKGFKVEFAEDGIQAIQAAEQHLPALILLDINMPEMDGYEACRKIKQNPDLESTPVIFISARPDALDKLDAFESGGIDYITKPFDPRELVARVNTHVQLRQAQYLLSKKNEELNTSLIELKKLEELRDNLIHMLLHDMRTPLSVVSTALNLMSDVIRLHGDADTQEDLKVAKENISNVLEMADDILEIRRLEQEDFPLEAGSHDINALILDVFHELEPLRGDNTFTAPAGSLILECDPGYIRRVISNLVMNGLKAMPEPGEIRIETCLQDDQVLISVSDTGTGIGEEAINSVFESFTRSGGESGYETTRSIGLGLSFCRLAVEAHNGSLSVASEPGKGSIFTIRLPMQLDKEISDMKGNGET